MEGNTAIYDLSSYKVSDTFSNIDYGGTGQVFDWRTIQNVRKPFFLAGGISKDNVAGAVSLANPYCIDISSSVETDAVKDRQKIIDFIYEVRGVI